jgi:hypothetical protein
MTFTTIGKAMKQTGLSYLGKVNASAKLAKNGKVNQHTYGLYLAPARTSGYNTCAFSTPECRMGCLNTSGRAGMEILAGKTKTQDSRSKKTRMLYEKPEFFMAWLIAEINVAKAKAQAEGFYFSVRLNCTSDVDWQNVRVDNKNIFEIFPDVQFYDYTKNPLKFNNKPSNYHLTLSYTGRNWELCEAVLEAGHNIAMVFNVKNEKQLPALYKGYKVVNGDLTDYRVADANGVIVGLKWKRIANREAEKQVLNSVFVIQPNDVNNSAEYINVQELEVA